MNQKLKYVICITLGFVVGYVIAAIGVYGINEDIYWGQYKHGLVEGYNMGFVSGEQFGQGKAIRYYQLQGFDLPYGVINRTGIFSEIDTTWYYAKGYESIDGVKESYLDYNPFD